MKGKSSANLLQAQRDYFGAHTYERKDVGGAFHTQWKSDLIFLVEYTKKQHDPNWTMLFLFPDIKGVHSENLIVFSITQTVLPDDLFFNSRQCSLSGLTQLAIRAMQSQDVWYAICLVEVSLQVAL